MSLPWFYPDRVSVAPGDELAIHASAPPGLYHLKISRVGSTNELKSTFEDIAIDQGEIPANVESCGCNWPVVLRFTIPADWKTGYYDLYLAGAEGEGTHHFFNLKPGPGKPRSRAAIVLATNTYQAYNYWGGANSYAHVEKLMRGEVDAAGSEQEAKGRLSRMRPYAQGLLMPRLGQPRLVNPAPRELGMAAHPATPEWMAEHQPSPYDFSACFVGKWEHAFVCWAEENGVELDYFTDQDLEAGAGILDPYRAVFLVGHSEYWSASARDAIDSLHEAGGNLIVFSGNTAYWKVRWEEDGQVMAVHKWRGESDDPLWGTPEEGRDGTHMWSHPAFGRPEAEMTGLSFLYGGYHRLGLCVGRGSAAYTIYDDKHWALEGTDLYYGDCIGGDIPLVGYENDGCPIRFDRRGLPAPDGGFGVPDDLSIIALAPATLFEDPAAPYPPIVPPGDIAILARIAHGEDNPVNRERLQHGHAVMASFRRGNGEVFNAGTTEWVHGLATGDPYVDRITRNVLTRFGVPIGAAD